MKAITPNSAMWALFVGITTYWILSVVVDPYILRDIFNNLSLGVAVTVAATWAQGAWRAFKEGADEGEWILVLAIFLTFIVLALQRIYAIVLAMTGRPDWLVNSPMSGFFAYAITVVGMLFLIAPGISEGAPRNKYWVHILFGVAGGAMLSGILIGLSIQT